MAPDGKNFNDKFQKQLWRGKETYGDCTITSNDFAEMFVKRFEMVLHRYDCPNKLPNCFYQIYFSFKVN